MGVRRWTKRNSQLKAQQSRHVNRSSPAVYGLIRLSFYFKPLFTLTKPKTFLAMHFFRPKEYLPWPAILLIFQKCLNKNYWTNTINFILICNNNGHNFIQFYRKRDISWWLNLTDNFITGSLQTKSVNV